MESGLALPFEGLAWPWQALFFAALVVIVFMLAWTTLLFVRAARWYRRAGQAGGGGDGASSFLWIFLVPALNEKEMVADSVERLLAVEAEHRRIVVIDDGSDDATASILAGIDHPDLDVITRSGTREAAALDEAAERRPGVVEGRRLPLARRGCRSGPSTEGPRRPRPRSGERRSKARPGRGVRQRRRRSPPAPGATA